MCLGGKEERIALETLTWKRTQESQYCCCQYRYQLASSHSLLPRRQQKCCLIRVSITVRKHHNRKQLGEGRLYFAYTSISQAITERSHGRNSRQKLWSSNWCRGRGGTPLDGLLPIACSSCFLIPSRMTCPGVGLLTVIWALQHQSQSRKCPTDFPLGQFCRRNSQLKFFLLKWLLCHVNKTLNRVSAQQSLWLPFVLGHLILNMVCRGGALKKVWAELTHAPNPVGDFFAL